MGSLPIGTFFMPSSADEWLSPRWLRALGLPLHVRSRPGHQLVEHRLRDPAAGRRVLRAALPLTLTPYAATGPCTARCVFCSENLRRTGSGRHASQLRPDADYFAGLRRALHALDGLPLGVSLSGLEPTADPAWFLQLLQVLQQHEACARLPFAEKILYTNGTALGDSATRDTLLAALRAFGLQRIEWSRHSHRQHANDSIMRFRPEVAVARQHEVEQALQATVAQLPVRLVCLVQRGGIDTSVRVRDYLQWAADQGVHEVVFREFARVDAGYHPSTTWQMLQRRRVRVEALVRRLLGSPHGLQPVALTEGYYFWGLDLQWQGRMQVRFEASDYARLDQCHAGDVVYKLVYHANGRLCADWDPHTRVVLDTRVSLPERLTVP